MHKGPISDVHVTKEEMLDFAKTQGNEQAYNLVLLYGPDCFDDFNVYEELTNLFKS